MTQTSLTAYWAAGVRMEDAAGPRSVCRDGLAHLFMDAEGHRVFDAAKHLERPRTSLLVRHRLIEEIIEQELARNASTHVVILGAGFDTRAYRLRGGRWIEIDTAQVIEHKEQCLPAARCPNPLLRLALDLQQESLEVLAGRCSDGPSLVVLEGVLMYLQEREIRKLLQDLRRILPGHRLVCDLMNSTFLKKYVHELEQIFAGMGAPFQFRHPAPHRFVEQQGYRLCHRQSLVGAGPRFGVMHIPWLVRTLFLRDLVEGSNVCLFAASE